MSDEQPKIETPSPPVVPDDAPAWMKRGFGSKGVGSRPPVRGSQRWYQAQLCEIVESGELTTKEKMHALDMLAKSRNNYRPKKSAIPRPHKKRAAVETPEPLSEGLAERITNYDSKPNGKGVLDGHQEEEGSQERAR